MAAYAVSKAAVVHLTTILDIELRPRGIRVNAVAPQLLDTPANRATFPAEVMTHAVGGDRRRDRLPGQRRRSAGQRGDTAGVRRLTGLTRRDALAAPARSGSASTATSAPHAAWPTRSPPEGGAGDLVAPFRRASRQPPGRRPPRPRVPCTTSAIARTRASWVIHSGSRSWEAHSPLGARPASPLSTARESPGSGDDLSPAWRRAWACREGSHGHQGTCPEIPGRYRDITSLRRQHRRGPARLRAYSAVGARPGPERS